jgi:hypothetical protein
MDKIIRVTVDIKPNEHWQELDTPERVGEAVVLNIEFLGEVNLVGTTETPQTVSGQ